MKLLALGLLWLAPAWAQTRAMRPEDTVAVVQIGEIAAGPKSPALLYSAAREWRQLGVDGPVAGLPAGASSLRWAPDGGRLAYFHEDALWLMDWPARRVSRVCVVRQSNAYLAQAGNALAWSPDGQWLAFAGTLEPAPETADPLVITRVLYKTRTSFSDNRRTHLFVVAASADGTPRRLTNGDWDEHSIDWRAGDEIVFLTNHEKDPDARLNYDIWAVNPGTGAVRQVTRTQGVEFGPKLSPDGRWVAYTATTRAMTTIDSVAEDDHVWVAPMGGGAAKEVAPKLDRRCGAVMWREGSTAPVFLAEDHGRTPLYEGARKVLERDMMAGGMVEFQGRLYMVMSGTRQARELWSWDGTELRQETHLNGKVVAEWALAKVERVAYRSFDGVEVEGWLYLPEGATAVPLILSVHGGPHGMSGYSFNPAAHYAAGRGYATLMLNPRGSSGYGQKFADGCVNNWGGGDYKDLMAGVDYVLGKYPVLDRRNLFVMGGSYGGFMTNWIVTQTSRFRAAVAAASVSNLISFYATSLYQDLVHQEFGYPWEGTNYVKLWNWSPLKYISQVKTPVMFLHGERDNDVHITQAEEMYTGLRQRGVEAVLVRYPREGHGFREPRHQVDATVRRLDWFDKFRVK